MASAASLPAQAIDSTTVAGLRWRNVGPANFMGRLADVVGIPGPSKTLFVAAAAGGVWKTTNNGQTWRPVFDDKRVASMGALAIAASDTQQVWLGTGEPHSRNSIEPGAGIYKSLDGGITWKLMGLEKTQHIGRIAVDPRNPNVVYVAALGAAWKSNPERGLYKTVDGGTTWQLVKFINDKTGFVDVMLDPRNPEVVYAAAYERLRTPYSLKSGGPGSGLFKSTDGGKSWTEISGSGFPTGPKGRIGLAMAASNPDVIYAMVEAAKPSKDGSFASERVPADNGLYRSADGGRTWTKTNNANTRPFYYSQVRVDPRNPDRVYFSSTQMMVSDEGGKNARPAAQSVHVDDHGMWIDPSDPERFVIADDGGIALTFDKGGNFIQPQNLPIAQFYEVSYDMAVPYNICSGAQDNGTWCGPSRRKSGSVNNAYWYTIAGGDGFYAAQDPTNPDIAFGESQGGNVSRVNVRTGERTGLRKPSWQELYKKWEDSIAVVRGDPLKPATKQVAAQVAALRARQVADSADLALRFNWNSPFFLSPHNAKTLYFAGNRVLKSTRQGDDLFLISPDLSKKLTAKIDTSMNLTGGITLDATGAETYGTVVALAESYVKAGLLFAGTDDGNVWKSPNDGATWESLNGRFPGLPNELYVARIEPSHFDSLTFWVAFDNHRHNDFTPYLYVTNDGGKSFKSIVNNLPKDMPGDFLHVVREDPVNANLLYVGSSVAVYASIDKGATWSRFMSGMPTVPVYDLQVHPRDHELIAATHGRSLWIVDVTPLQQLNATVLAAGAHLFAPRTAYQYGEAPNLMASGNGNAQAFFATPSPVYGADIAYMLPAGATGRIIIQGVAGDTLANIGATAGPGIRTFTWNFRSTVRAAVPGPLSASERRDSILKAVRAPVVLDSLVKAGYDSTAIARARQLLNPPAGGGGFGGRGGGGPGGRGGVGCERPLTQWDTFCARPGEGTPPRAGAAAAAEGGPQARGPEPENVKKIFGLIGLKVPAAAGRGFGGFGAGGTEASTGQYLVTLKVGDKSFKQVLKVERVSGGDSGFSPFGGDDEDHDR
ncbi:MAG: WD40/YVTN/BNR-like repeat-containing protein, partial [Gemmatimonadaceae bacterium]